MPTVETTRIPGLLLVRLDVHDDARGWFKESWHREHMVALGLPDFAPVQHNVAFNAPRGTTRGVHAEPWDKLVSLASGRAFGAWVDLREGPSFGATFHAELDPSIAVFVPRGVGNSYQTLEDDVAYSYLVTQHWRADVGYPALDLADATAAIPWPIPLADAVLSDKDRANPALADVVPVAPRRTVVLGADGQVGRALLDAFPAAEAISRAVLDITDAEAVEAWPWHDVGLILNAAAFTAVDDAETPAGRTAAWTANAAAPARLARIAARHQITLVHVSSDYVFDGSRSEHAEDEPLAPLGAYGQSKAAGELAVAGCPRHYLLRTSWVVGDGPNFVRTMQDLAARGGSPQVVGDQRGRLTFADELARAARHLVDARAPYGSYHVSNAGPATSWADVARRVFELCGRDPADVSEVTTAEFTTGRAAAPRPADSVLSLTKLEATGFTVEDADPALVRYLVGT